MGLTLACKQVAHLVHCNVHPEKKRAGWLVRLPVSVLDTLTKFRQWKHFQIERECSPLLEGILPCKFVRASWKTNEIGADAAKEVLLHGLNRQTVKDELGKDVYDHVWNGMPPFVPWLSTPRDHINLVAIEEKYAGLSLKDVGLHIDASKGMRTVAKRLHTVMTPMASVREGRNVRQLFAFGDVVRQHAGGVYIYRINGELYRILHRPETPLNNGLAGLVSDRFCQGVWGLKLDEGEMVRPRGLDPEGQEKGHALRKDRLAYDAIWFGAKKEVRFDRVFMGVQGFVHASRRLKMDFESLINFFGSHQAVDQLIGVGEEFIAQCLVAGNDSQLMRKMFLRQYDADQLTRQGVSYHFLKLDIDGIFPFLYKRQTATVLPKAYEAALGRIPFIDHAQYRYMSVPPDAFDAEGNDTPEASHLQGNVVYSPFLPVGKVGCYRQPNGNPGEHVIAENVAVPRGHRYFGMGKGNIIYLSPTHAVLMLKALGGADQDDPCVVVTDERFIRFLENAPAY